MTQLTVTTIMDGPRNAAVHVFIRGDGSGELTDEAVIDPAAFEAPLPPIPALKIAKLWYDLAGFDAWLEFDYLTSDTPIWSMSGNGPASLDFECPIGGLTDRSGELDGTGQLKLSTSGLGLGSMGTIIILVRKS